MTSFWTTQATVKTISLWNGSFNTSPPTNWNQVGFDDSAWSLSASPSVNTSHSDSTLNLTTGTFSGSGPIAPMEPIWPTHLQQNVLEGHVARWHWTFSANTTGSPPAVNFSLVNLVAGGGFFAFGSVGFRIYINGTEIPSGTYQNPSLNSSKQQLASTLVAGDNLFAVSNIPLTGWTYSDNAWFGTSLTIDTSGGRRSWGQVIG